MPRPMFLFHGLRLSWLGMACLAAMVLPAQGCSRSSGVPLAPVTGNVTFYGRPVVAEIFFQPTAPDGKPLGRPSTALSDSNGEFTLRFSDNEWGAVIGSHRVLVKVLPYADSGEPEGFYDATVPLKVAELHRDVRAGRNQLNFALTH